MTAYSQSAGTSWNEYELAGPAWNMGTKGGSPNWSSSMQTYARLPHTCYASPSHSAFQLAGSSQSTSTVRGARTRPGQRQRTRSCASIIHTLTERSSWKNYAPAPGSQLSCTLGQVSISFVLHGRTPARSLTT